MKLEYLFQGAALMVVFIIIMMFFLAYIRLIVWGGIVLFTIWVFMYYPITDPLFLNKIEEIKKIKITDDGIKNLLTPKGQQ